MQAGIASVAIYLGLIREVNSHVEPNVIWRNPTDREKKGSKRHLLVDGRGVPLSLVVTGLNAHDVTQLEAVLAAIVIKCPTAKQCRSKHLCADAGYRGKNAKAIILAHGYLPHVVGRKSEADGKKSDPTKKARRWVVQACHGWFNRFRKLLVRYKKRQHTFLALNHLAESIIALHKIIRLRRVGAILAMM